MMTVPYTCANPSCESRGWPRDVDVVVEPDTGARYVWVEDDTVCSDCGQAMEERT